jgi:SAM-dependent methyltransferase
MDDLPVADNAFDIALSRYALHHSTNPGALADELVRVVRPGGRVVVIDMAASPDRYAASTYYDTERLRDPSHVRNLTFVEQRQLFLDRGCLTAEQREYRLRARVDRILAGSHGPDHDGYRQAFTDSIATHRLGVNARQVHENIEFDYPIVGWAFTAPTTQNTNRISE